MAEFGGDALQQDDTKHAARDSSRLKQELIDRIHQYFQEVNADPVVFRWKYKLDEVVID